MRLRVPSNFSDYHEKELQIELIPYEEDIQDYNYYVRNFTEKKIEIQVNFSKPLDISQGWENDQLVVKLFKFFFAFPLPFRAR